MATGKSIILKDNTQKVLHSLQVLVKEQALVGIPESQDARDSGDITNAALGYIHEFGSPRANIPARPFLVPGVAKAKNAVIPQLRAACEFALKGDQQKSHNALVRAGMIGENFAKREITNGSFVPLTPATIANRYRARGAQSMRSSETRYMDLLNQGVSAAVAQAATGIKPLINTGALRRAITSVVRKV